MATSVSIEILDLRHFEAPMLRPVLEAEGEMWRERLHWDYRTSSKLLMQYLDSHMLPGYAALEAGQVTGYAFCVYEETKAVIGDVFALASRGIGQETSPGELMPASSGEIERTLLKHLFETLLNSPHVDRIESQLLIHASGVHSDIFNAAGFEVFRRLFMVQQLKNVWSHPHIDLPRGLELRTWRDEDLHVSHVVVSRGGREVVALVLGSRVSQQSGHITQLCVHPNYRRMGLARMLLSLAAFHFMRHGATEISLTVTESNTPAIDLYSAEGYVSAHVFDAAVWQRRQIA
jgi:ribosomal protein S18 acetylase RimI-like enzyme